MSLSSHLKRARDRWLRWRPRNVTIVQGRRFYWKHVRRYRYEICGSHVAGTPAADVIRRYGCGRPVGLVWRADSSFWNRMVTGEPLPPGRTEGAGGILCAPCFDRLCWDRGEARAWKADAL